MQTINAITTGATGNASGSLSAGTAANGASTVGGSGFGKMLAQAMGDSTEGIATSGGLPNLAQMLEGLLLQMPNGEAEGLLDGADAGAITNMLAQLAGGTGLMEKLLEDPDMQEWLAQAALLLQGMQLLPGVQPQVEAKVQENESANEGTVVPTAPTAINGQLARDILKAFAQASSQQPDNVFISQLQEKLAAILSKPPGTRLGDVSVQELSNMEQSQPIHEFAAKSGTNPVTTAKSRYDSLTGRNPNSPLHTQMGQMDIPNGNIQINGAGSSVNRLEMLAAKSKPLVKMDMQAIEMEQVGASLLDQESSGTDLPFSFTQDLNRLAPMKASLPADALIRADSFVEDFSQFMLGKLRTQTGNGLTEARLTLTPEALGQVEVKISMQNGQLVAQFAAHTAMGKEMLESQLQQLRASLQNQGIQVEKLEVTQSSAFQSGMFQDHHQQQRQSQQFQPQHDANRSDEGSEDYALQAADVLRTRKGTETDGFDVIA